MKMNAQEVTLLDMLDLSATFDTVNHNILLARLKEEFGVCGAASEWFKSSLANKGQGVSNNGALSQPSSFRLWCSTTAMSGTLFIIYASKLFKVVVDQLPHKLINIFYETIA